MNNGSMAFQFYGFTPNSVVKFFPFKELCILDEINGIEITEDSLISIIATMDIESGIMNNRYMIGSSGYIFPLDFDFCPPGIKCTFVVGRYNQTILFRLMLGLHELDNNNNKM